jgi:hypothetical protein
MAAANQYAASNLLEGAAALLHVSESGDHVGQYSDTYFTAGMIR